MQVSQIAESQTHVIIGGADVQAFTLEDSPELIEVLSKTLYREKKRAVVREIICNGWDAHIIGQCTHRPVMVTLNDEELIIRDFGPGIHNDKMARIYCSYGKSTKLSDGRQTGGFGLGSKAPFAYSDHFTVTSCHEGIRTVYAISRGGKLTKGKPDIRTMVRVPTTDTGITVSIPLKAGDKNEFASLVRTIAYEGGMKVELNGSLMRTANYEPMRDVGFTLVPLINQEYLHVLVGTVLYPLTPGNKDIDGPASELRKLLGATEYEDYRGINSMILMAKPNVIGVTPSREALSNSDETVEEVVRMINRAVGMIKARAGAVYRKCYSDLLKKNGITPYDSLPKFSTSGGGPTKTLDDLVEDLLPFSANHLLPNKKLPGDHHPGDQRKRRHQIAAQVFGAEHARFFRRGNIKEESGSPLARSSRIHCRITGKLGLWSNMYVIGPDYRRKLPKAFIDLHLARETIVIADRASDLTLTQAGLTVSRRQLIMGFVRLSADQEAQLRALCERYNIEVVKAERVAPAPKKVVEEGPDLKIRASTFKEEEFTPTHYLHLRQSEMEDHYSWRIRDFTARYYPDTVIISGNQRKGMEAAGVKDLYATLAAEYLEGLSTPKGALATILSTPQGYVSGLAKDLLDGDFRFASIVFGKKVKVDAQVERLYRVKRFLDMIEPAAHYQQSNALSDLRRKMATARRAMSGVPFITEHLKFWENKPMLQILEFSEYAYRNIDDPLKRDAYAHRYIKMFLHAAKHK